MNIFINYIFHIDVNEDILIERIKKRASEDGVLGKMTKQKFCRKT